MPSFYLLVKGAFRLSGALLKMKGERKMKTAKTGQRRIFGVIASLLILVLTLSVLVGCKPTGEVSDVGTATVVVAVGEDVRSYTVPLDKVDGSVGAIILLDYLKTEGELDYTSVDGIYGAYLTKVGHLEEKAGEGIYVGIWTNVESDIDRESVYSSTVEYNGVTLYSANVGMGELNVPDGAIICFGEMKY